MRVMLLGTVTLVISDTLDLDDGLSNPAEGADIGYEYIQGFHALIPQGSARLGIMGNLEPSPAACQTASLSAAPIPVESLPAGAYLCYQTGQGQSGWLRYQELNAADGTLQLGYHTWAAPDLSPFAGARRPRHAAALNTR